MRNDFVRERLASFAEETDRMEPGSPNVNGMWTPPYVGVLTGSKYYLESERFR